ALALRDVVTTGCAQQERRLVAMHVAVVRLERRIAVVLDARPAPHLPPLHRRRCGGGEPPEVVGGGAGDLRLGSARRGLEVLPRLVRPSCTQASDAGKVAGAAGLGRRALRRLVEQRRRPLVLPSLEG